MALSTARIHRVRGRPPLLAAGITSLIHSHSSSLRSLGYVCSSIYLYYTTHREFSDRLLEYRIRRTLQEHEATFPDQKGKHIQTPTARWVFHYFVGIHVLYIPGQGLMILNLTD